MPHIELGNTVVPVSTVAKNIGVFFDDALSMNNQVQPRASIGGGRGGRVPPLFSVGGQHRNCPPTFQLRKIARHIALLTTPLS